MAAAAEMETRMVCQVPTGESRFIEIVPCLKFGLQEEMAHFVKYLNIYSLICLALFSRKKRTIVAVIHMCRKLSLKYLSGNEYFGYK
jgi:hypothetical protein